MQVSCKTVPKNFDLVLGIRCAELSAESRGRVRTRLVRGRGNGNARHKLNGQSVLCPEDDILAHSAMSLQNSWLLNGSSHAKLDNWISRGSFAPCLLPALPHAKLHKTVPRPSVPHAKSRSCACPASGTRTEHTQINRQVDAIQSALAIGECQYETLGFHH